MKLGAVVYSAVLFVASACTSSDPQTSDTTWVGTITTAGNVTTVVNESGSVWGGRATLVEEMSIGVESGADEYMFGRVRGIAASDQRIYVVDATIPTVRVYDLDGRHVADIGSGGDGPGEFRRPASIAVGPTGRLFVLDANNRQILVFGSDGEFVDTWRFPSGPFPVSGRLIISPDGAVYARQQIEPGIRGEMGMVPFGADGTPGEPLAQPTFDIEVPRLQRSDGGGGFVPFWPQPAWDMSPSGAMIGGVPSDYRFEIRHADGHTTVVSRTWDPVPLESDEADWYRQELVNRFRDREPGWTWAGPEIPRHKPAFDELYADWSERIWVRRRGPGIQSDDCGEPSTSEPEAIERSCWRNSQVVEVFDEEGRYLGSVDFPHAIRFQTSAPYIRGDMFVTYIMDDAGTIMVKRYRLVLPGEDEQ